MNRVRAIILDTSGRFLLGFDPNTQEYSLLGGGLQAGEHPVDGLLREVKEEGGLVQFETIEYLFDYLDNHVFSLITTPVPTAPNTANDPDNEFSKLVWCEADAFPPQLSEFSMDIIYHFLNDGQGKPVVAAAPEGLQVRKLGNKYELHKPGFSAIVNVPTKTAKVMKFDGDPKLLESLETFAREHGILRIITDGPGEDLEIWKRLGYKIEKREGSTPLVKKVLVPVAAKLEVLVDGVKFAELEDDVIWETLPRLAQERAKGKKVSFRQVLDDGTVIDFNTNVLPEYFEADHGEGT